ncbi:hypothetical protein SETIT_5G314000v2 [Setaria italica]|uniref:CYTH domain-containing protein n=1 Tax=Setaria italica TaxID=4555 RepID=K3XT58_SETIT|nr:hypothetical protein SETIT_5G314000v2 [Setaria italica]
MPPPFFRDAASFRFLPRPPLRPRRPRPPITRGARAQAPPTDRCRCQPRRGGRPGFRNTRAIYELEDQGLVLELDETRFGFRTSYELECETPEPDQVKEVLERLLTVAGVPYDYSRSNKFACFMAGKLLP